MLKNILLILGHPSQEFFCEALLLSYKIGADASGTSCKTLNQSELNFNPNLSIGYKNRATIHRNNDLLNAHQLILWAYHLVLAYPNWWGSMLALTKGFIDRIFLPGFAFKHRTAKAFPDKLLKDKSILFLVKIGTSKWWFYMVNHVAQYHMLKQTVFGYLGFNQIKFSKFRTLRTLI